VNRLLWFCAVLMAVITLAECAEKKWKPQPLKPGAWYVDRK
jgi:hypothetical protein